MSSPSATDVITYIGVPLAVLGVLPILYNTIATLLALQRIKRMLKRSALTALTRTDVVNRVIEVELPRYAATPWDRFDDKQRYWSLSMHPSGIPGGTWTTFHWRMNAIGIKTQRIEYADQLRQPQVEIAFDELVSYLLDLGAVPDQHGWKLLRSTGLWTPVGCVLMKSPDGRETALMIAPLDDAEGNLSLAVSWSSTWITRDATSLPPYWVRLPPAAVAAADKDGVSSVDRSSSSPAYSPMQNGKEKEGKESQTRVSIGSSHSQEVGSNGPRPITCQISVDGLVTALTQEVQLHGTVHLDSLYIEHVRVRHARTDGIWFASAATAYGTTSQTILWNYTIPADILAFSRKDTVPCGLLVLLGAVDESDTPEWATNYSDHGRTLELHVQRTNEQRAAISAESVMAPAQRQLAVAQRMRKETEQRMMDLREMSRTTHERRERRVLEALQSPKWDTTLVATHELAWLKEHGHLSPSVGLREAVGQTLHRMVLDGQFAATLCRMLDLWKAWADNGGMRKLDVATVEADKVTFAQATLIVAVIKDTSGALQGTLSMDLQECLHMWRKVRLG